MAKRRSGKQDSPRGAARRSRPKLDRVVEGLRRGIERGEYPYMLPGIQRLADQYGVSQMTADAAVRELVEEGLLTRKRRLGTFVRHAHPDRGTVAVLCAASLLDGRGSFYFSRALFETQRVLMERGFRPTFIVAGETPVRIPGLGPEAKGGRPPAAVIAIAANAACAPAMELARAAGIPVVSGTAARPGSSLVAHDNEAMIREGVRLLSEGGCRRPALLTHGRPGTEEPLEGTRAMLGAELARQGLAMRPDWCMGEVMTDLPESQWTRFNALWSGRPRPDGLFVLDDTLYPEAALGVLRAGRRVPEDVLVVSHANRGSGMHCPFPTILLEFDPVAMGRALAAAVEDRNHAHGPGTRLPHRVINSEEIFALRQVHRLRRSRASR